MTPEQIDRVFGCGRLQMVTGKHVEVFREAAAVGTRRRYTKRFLHTLEADFGQWTEREWRILARLIGHGIACVPDVVQYDRGAPGGTQLVQTYDAGVTVDQWATILPVTRNGFTLRHVFEDCAHWWALAHHCLRALQAIHELSVVHLDIKGDNVCIPFGPPGFDPHGADLHIFPRFTDLALIDFAFALVSRESLTTALPIGWQTDYDYQSPRLLHALEAGRRGDLQPTRQLDWRCDMYSLGAMLKRYLPDDEVINDPGPTGGWSAAHVQAAKELILALREVHDGEATLGHPHARLLELTAARIDHADMAVSLASGWTLARDTNVTPVAASPATPVTRLAPALRVVVTPRVTIEPLAAPAVVRRRPSRPSPAPPLPPPPARRGRLLAAAAVFALVSIGAIAVAAPDFRHRLTTLGEFGRSMLNLARAAIEPPQPRVEAPAAAGVPERVASASAADAGAGAPASPAPVDEAAQADAPASPADAGGAAQEAINDVGAPNGAAAPGLDGRAEPALTSPPGTEARSTQALTTTPPRATAPASPPQTPVVAAARPKTKEGVKAAGLTPRSSKLADARPRPNTSTKAKLASPSAVAASPKRIGVFDGKPTRSGTSASPVVPGATPATSTGEKAAPPSTLPASVDIEPVVTASAGAAVPGSVGPSTSAATAATNVTPAPPAAASAPAGVTPLPSAAATAPARIAPGAAPRPPARPAAGGEPRNILTALADLALRRDRGKAPIEDRPVPSPRTPLGSPPSAVASAAPVTRDTGGSESTRPIASPSAPTGDSQPPAPALAPAPAPEVRTYAVPPMTEPRPVPRELAPRFAPPEPLVARDPYRGGETDTPDLAAQARRALAESVPYAAARAQADVARVLRVAAYAAHPAQEGEIVDAVHRGWPTHRIATNAPGTWPASARQLSGDARRAYVVQRNVGQAFELQLRAFGANPGDPDVAGDLAFLLLKVNPAQAETARQLSLHAIALRPSQRRAPLADDWSTLAIASGLTGREADATNALYVVVALSRNLDRDCRTALGAIDRHGDLMLAPVQAMMLRIRQHGRHGESPNCAWPVNSRMARGY